MSLFRNIAFTGHSGQSLTWKIECDELTPDDWAWAAARVAERVSFWHVEPIPKGGLPFAEALQPFIRKNGRHFLVVDDVLTTGRSMSEVPLRLGDSVRPPVLGVVLFARIPPPEPWIKALFAMSEWA